MRHVPCIGNVQGDMRPCLLLCMSHLLVMYNRNHSCLVSSPFSVLVERLVSVVAKCVVKDQQVGPFCSSFVYVAINFFFNSVGRLKSMDSSSTKDMNSPAISGDMLAAVASSGSAGDSVLDVLLSDSTREELDGWAVTLGLDPSDYKDKTQLKRAMYAAHSTQRVAGPAQVDSVQSPPQDILQVPSASAALTREP